MSGDAGAPPFWAEDPDGAAGEYVLGTLDAAERAAFARALERDAALRAAVAAWEARLAPLAAAAPAVAPDPRVWAAVEARIAGRPEAGEGGDIGGARILRLERGLRRWRLAAGAAAALAAGLALWIAAGPRPAGETAQYLAVVDRGGGLPALIVRVDLAGGSVQVRSLAAETPPDHSLELWYVGAGAAPRSLGLVGAAEGRLTLPAALRTGLEGASLAVSVEPKGGSPTGAPTGPVVYSGKLVRE
ncbi:anti-sigma factor [Methylobacterium symbioticum]|uniref:anti-sigma factor n=1 Tax=uncultured Methylobacterium sp. TaxID=157278 RepID=UPI002599C40B|nr:anti-sigma factor [uncultured Methylobacterium sp.]